MEIPVLDAQRAVGTAQVRREGLYTYFSAALPPGGVVRVWGCWPDGWALLGIPEPDGAGMRLKRKISTQSLPEGKPLRLCMEKSGLLRPWAGEIDGYAVRHAAARLEADGATVYLPFFADRPFALVPLFRLCWLEDVLGGRAAAICVDARGQARVRPTGQWSEP